MTTVASKSRADRLVPWAAVVLLAALSLFYLLLIVDSYWHQQWDSGTYLMTARNLAAGRGYTLFDEPFFSRPPGFAYFLTWFVGASGEFNFHALNVLMTLIALASLVPLFLVVRGLQGDAVALGVTALFATSPLFVSQLNLILSDTLFLLLFYSALWLLISSHEHASGRDLRGWAGAILLGASIYVRTIGIGLLLGMVIHALRLPRGKRLTAMCQVVLVVLMLIPWVRYASHSAATAPRPPTQLLVFDYGTALRHEDPGDPESRLLGLSDWASRTRTNVIALAYDISRNVAHLRHKPVAVAVVLFVLLGFVIACRRGVSLLDWWAISCTGIIALYFTYSSRLVLPLVPAILYYVVVSLKTFARGRAAVVVVPVVTILALNIALMNRYLDPSYEPNAERRPIIWQANETAAAWIRANTPANAVILHRTPATFEALTQRRALGYWYLRGRPLPQTDYAVLMGRAEDFESRFREANLGTWVLPGPEFEVRIYRLK